ncbi:MAG: helix-turn-helix domain-containing protein [Cognaticolwellia sp.]
MYIKKLREEQKWSQDQLASMTGLNIRTIQRIENGKRASIDSIKALAAVFDVSASTIMQEVVTIDKSSKKWQQLPLIFRLNFVGSEIGWLGLSQRKDWLRGEEQVAVFGIVLCLLGFFDNAFFISGLLMLLIAYLLSFVLRAGDRYSIW